MRIQSKGIIFHKPRTVIKKKKISKKLKTNDFLHIRLLLLIVLFSLLSVTGFFFQRSVPDDSFPTKAFSEDSTLASIPSYLAPSPTATPSANYPFIKNLDASIGDSGAATSSAGQEDYCLDVPVLLYHHIQPLEEATLLGHAQLTVDSNIFDEQMKYLVDNGYTTLSADDLVNALLNRQPLPKKPILITIDDGYVDDYTYGFMAAKKYNLIMNFMIPTSLIGGADYMTWDHLKEMAQSPYARIYNHTATHAPVGLLDKDQIDGELATSSAAFKQQLNLQPNIFTYPYGSYSDLAIQELRSHGFIAAFTTDEGRHQCASSIMKLQRNHIGNAPLSEYGL